MQPTKKAILATAACLAVSVSAFAGPVGCPLNENAQVSVSFNGTDKDAGAVKEKLDSKIAEIKTMAADQHFTKFEMQSSNYSINANGGGYGQEMQYQYSGSVSFSILPADKGADFMVMLTKKGYQASVSVSSYGGNCAR